ncbi:MAG: hypothetical protein R3185_04145 [Candidatus Thermoplasmatota archaeon]|nr:hypothetical protein [Candidatus Thermoplasmatota archaeon]
MIVAAAFVLAVALLSTSLVYHRLEQGRHRMAVQEGDLVAPFHLEARDALVDAMRAAPADARNATLTSVLQASVDPVVKAARAYSVEVHAVLAGGAVAPSEQEAAFVEPGGTYTGIVTVDGEVVAQGEPWDGANDGVIHVGVQPEAVLVRLHVQGARADVQELLIIGLASSG